MAIAVNEIGQMEDFIKIYDKAVSDSHCDQICKKFDADQSTYQGHAGPEVDVRIKDSMDLNITNLDDWASVNRVIVDAVFKCLVDYMSHHSFMLVGANIPIFKHPETGEVCKLTHENFDEFGRPYIDTLIVQTYRLGQMNIQKYVVNQGGYHHWHSEICADDKDCETLHRALFFILYLNDVDAGGETEFFYQDKKVSPQKGRIILSPAGFTHTHKGQIPVSNEKLIATSWVMFNRFE
jgi:hypothetical protein